MTYCIFLTTVKHFSQKWNAETHWMEYALAPPWADLNHPLELFSERTSSIYRNVKLKHWASFFSFFFRSPCMKCASYE
jgi:hypothetical protein